MEKKYLQSLCVFSIFILIVFHFFIIMTQNSDVLLFPPHFFWWLEIAPSPAGGALANHLCRLCQNLQIVSPICGVLTVPYKALKVFHLSFTGFEHGNRHV